MLSMSKYIENSLQSANDFIIKKTNHKQKKNKQ